MAWNDEFAAGALETARTKLGEAMSEVASVIIHQMLSHESEREAVKDMWTRLETEDALLQSLIKIAKATAKQ